MSAPTTAQLADHLVMTHDALPETAETLARIVADRLRWQGDGRAPVVLDAFGKPQVDVTPDALLARFAAEMPELFRSKPPAATTTPPAAKPMTLTERARVEHQARQAPATDPGANPWRSGNLTRQALIERDDPARAARLRAEARA